MQVQATDKFWSLLHNAIVNRTPILEHKDFSDDFLYILEGKISVYFLDSCDQPLTDIQQFEPRHPSFWDIYNEYSSSPVSVSRVCNYLGLWNDIWFVEKCKAMFRDAVENPSLENYRFLHNFHDFWYAYDENIELYCSVEQAITSAEWQKLFSHLQELRIDFLNNRLPQIFEEVNAQQSNIQALYWSFSESIGYPLEEEFEQRINLFLRDNCVSESRRESEWKLSLTRNDRECDKAETRFHSYLSDLFSENYHISGADTEVVKQLSKECEMGFSYFNISGLEETKLSVSEVVSNMTLTCCGSVICLLETTFGLYGIQILALC